MSAQLGRGARPGYSAGIGFLAMFKSEGTQIAAGVAGVCVAGLVVGGAWFASISDKKPKTLTAEWKKGSAKYREAMNHDPIRNQS